MEFALIILGGGPAGYVAALRAHTLLKKQGVLENAILLIDDHPYLGGTCLNEGCIPSKTLLHHSAHSSAHRENSENSATRSGDRVDVWQKMQQEKDYVMGGLGQGIAYLMKNRGVKVVRGFGSAYPLEDGRIEVKVKQNKDARDTDKAPVDEESFIGKKLLLATGSKPIALPGLSFDQKQIISSTEALSLQKPPRKLAVVGAGVIGLEISSIFARLGSQVEVFEIASHSCGPVDRELSKQLEGLLQKQGIKFHFNTKIDLQSIKKDASTVSFSAAKVHHRVDSLLVAIGRKPSVRGCEGLKLAMDPKGRIVVNDSFQTSCTNVYATGDVVDGPMLAHKASEEALVAVDMLFGNARKLHYVTIPNVVYTSPEIASVGLSEEVARERGLEIVVGRSHMKANSRAKCTTHTQGLVKIIADKPSGRIIGLHILAEGASEMIAIGSLCLAGSMALEDLAYLPFAHPTMSEAIREAAWSALGEPLHN